jgi:hypothetical protein
MKTCLALLLIGVSTAAAAVQGATQPVALRGVRAPAGGRTSDLATNSGIATTDTLNVSDLVSDVVLRSCAKQVASCTDDEYCAEELLAVACLEDQGCVSELEDELKDEAELNDLSSPELVPLLELELEAALADRGLGAVAETLDECVQSVVPSVAPDSHGSVHRSLALVRNQGQSRRDLSLTVLGIKLGLKFGLKAGVKGGLKGVGKKVGGFFKKLFGKKPKVTRGH